MMSDVPSYPPTANPTPTSLLAPGVPAAAHEAFALAISSTFWVSIGAAVLAAVLVVFLRDTPQGTNASEAAAESPSNGA